MQGWNPLASQFALLSNMIVLEEVVGTDAKKFERIVGETWKYGVVNTNKLSCF